MPYTRPEFWWRQAPAEVQSLSELIIWAMSDASDVRTKNWWSMDSPSVNWSLTILYLLMVWFGPKVMKDRKAWDVKNVMIVYNIVIIFLNAYMFFEIFMQTVMLNMSWVGNEVDYSEKSVGLANVLYLYYFSKLIDYLDTFFLIVKKNNHQLSFLHVYHHSFMFWVWWLGIRFAAGGDTYFSAWVNCLVHVVMYSYYLARCFGIHVRGKKLVTVLQLSQFMLVIGHSATSLYLDTRYPQWIMWSLIAFLLSLLVLFLNFFHMEYNVRGRAKAPRREPSVSVKED